MQNIDIRKTRSILQSFKNTGPSVCDVHTVIICWQPEIFQFHTLQQNRISWKPNERPNLYWRPIYLATNLFGYKFILATRYLSEFALVATNSFKLGGKHQLDPLGFPYFSFSDPISLEKEYFTACPVCIYIKVPFCLGALNK